MGFLFIGERVPELAGLEPAERRRIFRKAVGRSYLRIPTWCGFCAFVAIITHVDTIANAIYSILDKDLFAETTTVSRLSSLTVLFALICLWAFQMSEVRKEIKKLRNPDQKVAPVN